MPKLFTTARYAACLSILAVAGCSGLASPGSVPAAQSAAAGRASQSSDMLYTGAKHRIEISSYPAGSIITSYKVPQSVQSMCADTSGDVFITAIGKGPNGGSVGYVLESSQGARPVTSITMPKHQLPVNCSSDPTSGNLAVTSYNVRSFAPQIEIYANATGTPTVYRSNVIGAAPQPAYDASGDLLVMSSGNVAVELPKSQNSLVTIKLEETLGVVTHAQWDGKYFALQSFQRTQHNKERLLEHVYRLKISGTGGVIVGYSHFVNWQTRDSGQSWIVDGTMVATPGKDIVFWKYPGGGKPIKSVVPPYITQAVTVSTTQ